MRRYRQKKAEHHSTANSASVKLLAWIVGLLALGGFGVAVWAGCFQCPSGPDCIVQPSAPCPQGVNTPPDDKGFYCYYYCAEGLKYGACEACYEPSYKKCDTVNTYMCTEYLGRCAGVYDCRKGIRYPSYLSSFMAPLSEDQGFCSPP
jgi:hypothetical protein